MLDRLMRWLDFSSAQDRPPVPVAAPESATDAAAIAAYSQGVEHFRRSEFDLAAQALSEALQLKHDLAEAHYYLGLTLREQLQLEDAADCLLLATTFRPDFAEAWFFLGAVDLARKCYDAARRSFKTALRLKPGYAEAQNGLGACWLELGDAGRAADSFEKAIAARPDFALAHSNLGYVLLRDLGDFERGATHIETALRLMPHEDGVWCNYTLVLWRQGRLDEAIAICDRLLAARPDLHEARLNRALAELKLGHFEKAWPDYEARKHTRSNYVPRPFKFPEWSGEALTERAVFVYAEQGLGDEIMFSSCLPDLIVRAGRCVVECSPRLEKLFARSFPGVCVYAGEQTDKDHGWLPSIGHIDYQVAIGSLPGYFRRQPADFPAHQGYLRADAERTSRWRQRLQGLGDGLKVGISWRGGSMHTSQPDRSIDAERLLPLLTASGCEFVSLQYGDCEVDLDSLQQRYGVRVQHWQEAIENYDETAALVSALDLIITVDTSVAHLSGALGRPTWVLVPANADWRYLAAGERMPWFPAMRLFRRIHGAGWEPAIDRVAAELAGVARRT